MVRVGLRYAKDTENINGRALLPRIEPPQRMRESLPRPGDDEVFVADTVGLEHTLRPYG